VKRAIAAKNSRLHSSECVYVCCCWSSVYSVICHTVYTTFTRPPPAHASSHAHTTAQKLFSAVGPRVRNSLQPAQPRQLLNYRARYRRQYVFCQWQTKAQRIVTLDFKLRYKNNLTYLLTYLLPHEKKRYLQLFNLLFIRQQNKKKTNMCKDALFQLLILVRCNYPGLFFKTKTVFVVVPETQTLVSKTTPPLTLRHMIVQVMPGIQVRRWSRFPPHNIWFRGGVAAP